MVGTLRPTIARKFWVAREGLEAAPEEAARGEDATSSDERKADAGREAEEAEEPEAGREEGREAAEEGEEEAERAGGVVLCPLSTTSRKAILTVSLSSLGCGFCTRKPRIEIKKKKAKEATVKKRALDVPYTWGMLFACSVARFPLNNPYKSCARW